MSGFPTLLYKETLRFWKVGFQTIAAPVLTSLLYLLIFSSALDGASRIQGVPYLSFLIPGLTLMSVLQNAFANSSSSLIQSKVTGSVIFVLLPPISHLEFFLAYLIAALLRGAMVGVGVFLVTFLFAPPHWAVSPAWVLAFFVLGGGVMGALGIIAGIWADKFDQLAGFQNFLVMPLTMLSGVFYSIHALPVFWQKVSRFNPLFYMIDGFRYGFLGVSDISPFLSLAVGAGCLLFVGALAFALIRRGYKLRY